MATKLISTVGGAAGPLFGTAYLKAAQAAGDATELDADALVAVLTAARDGVVSRAARPRSATRRWSTPGRPAVDAATRQPQAAESPGARCSRPPPTPPRTGAEATEPLVAHKGRASYLGERAVGHRDPGAQSTGVHPARRGGRGDGRAVTVGILVVSHSAAIATGTVELARQMAADVPLVAAGGTDDGGIGTSFEAITAGIEELAAADAVVVLCDLGSAYLTTDTALDFLDDDVRARVHVSRRPARRGRGRRGGRRPDGWRRRRGARGRRIGRSVRGGREQRLPSVR